MQNMSVFLQVLWEDCSQQKTVSHFECSRLIVYISLCRALSYRESTLSRSPSASPSVSTPPQKEKLGKKTSVSSVAGKTAKRPPNSPAPSQRLLPPPSSSAVIRYFNPFLSPPAPATFTIPRSPTAEELALHVKLEGALSYEVGLIILGVLDTFMEGMTSELSQAMGDNYFMAKV